MTNDKSSCRCKYVDDEDADARKVDKWQDKISSGFDRLMSFASTELDKRRRSTEGGDSAASCNTSPDSGIGHGDPPPPPPALSAPAAKKRGYETGGASPGPKMPRLFKTPPSKPSPGRDSPPVLEAPLADETAGPPRTPSPSSSADEPPLLPPSPAPLDGPYSPAPAQGSPPPQPKAQGDHKSHHFKKKFFHRENWNWQHGGHHHKGKFRPKGKDWEWHGSKTHAAPPHPDFSVPPPHLVNTALPPPYHPHHRNGSRYRGGAAQSWDRFEGKFHF